MFGLAPPFLESEMYWPDVKEIKGFYESPLGAAVAKLLRAEVKRYLGDAHNSEILGIGFAGPYLLPFLNRKIPPIALMPAKQGSAPWPGGEKNLSLLAKESSLPFADDSFDIVLVAHAIEYTGNQIGLLEEAWRVLKPNGKILIIAPNRVSIWSRSGKTPFGFGHSFTGLNLTALINDAGFTMKSMDTAIFIPPVNNRLLLKYQNAINLVAGKIVHPLGGVIIATAEKQIYGLTSRIKKEIPAPAYKAATEGLKNCPALG